MRSIIDAFSDVARLLRSMGSALWHRKAWWMVPIAVVLVLVLVVVVLSETPLAPFIYTLF